jgi:hypothetical protein
VSTDLHGHYMGGWGVGALYWGVLYLKTDTSASDREVRN